MNEEINKKEDKVRFNLGSVQLMLIGHLMQKASLQYLKGELSHWFYTLKSIKLTIISRLDNKERRQLRKQERIIAFVMNKVSDQGEDNKQYSGALCNLIEKYDITIKEKLESGGFLVPGKQDKTILFGQDKFDSFAQPDAEDED